MTLLRLKNSVLPTMDSFANEFFGGNPFKLFENNFFGSVLSNTKENEKNYEISLSLPGFDKKDIDIEINDDRITIKSDVEKTNEQNDENYIRKEFYKSSFEKSFYIPENVDKDKIDAEMKNGILILTLNKYEKMEENKPIKKIDIK